MVDDEAETCLAVYDIALQLLLSVTESIFIQLTVFCFNENHSRRIIRWRKNDIYPAVGFGPLVLN